MKVSAIKCPRCADVVWSRARHDMRYCSCKYCYIDGGRSYTHIGWGSEYRHAWPEDLKIMSQMDTEYWGQPKTIELEVPNSPPHKEPRWPY